MFLKSIEIRGFKSFADKTELIFKNGVTAVVGPNGSGKSNISDAVRWVLGEQSVRSLRGDKMEDVIFSGTQYRKPVGLAQVSLTLDNADSELEIDYSDVTISRRLYRSGESEYLINNTSCRLKDVQALFMDTGIGKEGYSIIGQGKIDAILSGKSDDRRRLLEEAAGIVKYKTRKEEAEKKIENTDQNLIRINDIISTYEERLGPLQNESEKARKFIMLSEKIKNKEINIIIDGVNNTNIRVEKLNDLIDKIKLEILQLLNNRTSLKSDLDIKNKELDNFNKIYEEKRSLYYEIKEKHQGIITEIQLLEGKINSSKENLDRLTELVYITKKEIDLEEEKIIGFDNKLHELTKKQNDFSEDILSIEEEIKETMFNIKGFNDKLNDLENIKQKYLNEKNKVNNEISLLDNNIQLSSQYIDNLLYDVQSYKNSIVINNTTKELLQVEENNINLKIAKYEENINENKRNISKLKQSYTLKEKQLKDLNKFQNNLEARVNVLINLENTYEGYNKSVKNLMQYITKENLYKINEECFVLGDIITVDKAYETAIEIALGGSISNIVTLDENIAKDLINKLKKNNLGRATFLPMTIIKGKVLELDNNITQLKGYVGIASNLVNFNYRFKGVIDNALGKTIICDNMDNGLNIAKISGYKYRIVTLEGEVINPGGALTGGSYSRSANIMGRKREIEELNEAINKGSKSIGDLNSQIRKLGEEIKTLDEESLNLKDNVHFERIEIAKINEKTASILDEAIKLKKDLEKTCADLKNEEIKLNGLLKDKNKKEKDLTELQFNLNKYEDEYEKIYLNVSNKNDKIEEYKENLTSLKVNKAKLDEVINNQLQEKHRIISELNNNNVKLKDIMDEIETKSNERENFIKIKAEKHSCVDNILSEINELEKAFKEIEIERVKMKEKIPVIMGNIENINIELDKYEKDIHKQEVILVKLETEQESMINKLNEEYNLTFAEALDLKEEVIDVKSLKDETINLKAQISELGVVNVRAIEEFKEVKEKFHFMNNQREDLVKAKEELNHVIEEMTNKMRVVFKENFEKLRINFNETFKELFKGGSADLILQGDDELSAKIEINVEPPGKKLQNINLMSGGEKVLSAIALLFSILKMKPTPFCILDEIEAALDDANVIRYGEFLKKFSENIQFVVITHRKGTMEASDMIYGVTMEEKGVSKVVSIDFTK